MKKQLKVLTIIGARPQFVKAATVSRAMRLIPEITEILVHTGQHYDTNMSEIFFSELDIPKANYYLDIGSGTHGMQTGRMIESIEQVLLKEQPHWVLVYGDTNSTLAGAIAASKLHIPVAHVEAGLRSFNRKMPEEINRVLTDHISNLMFAPTEIAVKNLTFEGLSRDDIHLVGDVMYDAALYYANKVENSKGDILEKLGLKSKHYSILTIHRAENTDNLIHLDAIFKGLVDVSRDTTIVVPLHPRTQKALEHAGLLDEVSQHLKLIPPVGYLDMIVLEKNARLIITDSGGVQKEAFFYQVPCLTLRTETEWVELVELGWNQLLEPTSRQAIKSGFQNAISAEKSHNESPKIYGNGQAALKILDILTRS
jgi:UDP-GlcNAc3NAcA epimerase